ncbi:MAG: hypothetical protein KJN59_00920 [Bacteroidia bacterium]|nr:hypothetical protein [Bacteroidia bacterium]NNF83179.1 hypothetical protein [Flavobacteriaceae bacterium]
MKLLIICMLFFSGSIWYVPEIQTVPSVEEVNQFFNGSNIMISYREGGPIYGTFYVLEIHYCPNGYGLYGQTSKQTVMGNYQNSNWQEFGTWKVIEQDGLVGLYYSPLNGQPNFVPVYKLGDGSFFIREGLTIVKQGQAICY